ncbi:MAG: CoA transferase [Actinomycetota bacterium]|nr:CoA transferase [Actinomycetota bacterium]
MGTALRGVPLAARTCARRLAAPGRDTDPTVDVECDISWFGPARVAPDRAGSEAVVQALSGLMAVHGRDGGRPRRLGLEVASVAAGMLAAQAVIAARIGQQRGHEASPPPTSVLQAALLLMSHYVAAATAGGDQVPTAPGPEPGPPFRTADDRWFEIEVFDPEAWRRFWIELGAEGVDLGRAWTSFRGRYYRGDCSFPVGLHQATRAHSLAHAAAAAEHCRVSLCPVRDYAEVRVEPGWSAGYPTVTPRSGQDSGAYRPRNPAQNGGPLAGLRVVEATNRMQGPLAGRLLQWLGADVMKVEPPGGDPGRMVPPEAGETGSFFACFNSGKTSVELDLTTPAGRDGLMGVLAGADVFLHNWRPGKATQWGLDTTDVARAHPRIVYVTASGWGDLPHNDRLIGTDFLVQAYAGVAHGIEPASAPPRPTRVLVTDFMGALVTCEGVLSGLYRRETTGAGVAVGTSLLQGALALQAHLFEGMESGSEEGRRDGRPVWGPLDEPLATNDGYVVVTADDLDPLLLERVRDRSAEEWEKLLTEAGVPCAAVATDLSTLPRQPALVHLYEPLGGTAMGPRSPWEAAGR